MELFIIHFIQQHFELLKYVALGIGGIYSTYRKVIADRRSDRLKEQQVDIISQLAEKAMSHIRHHEEHTIEHDPNEETKKVLRSQEDLRHVVDGLVSTVNDLRQQLDEKKRDPDKGPPTQGVASRPHDKEERGNS